MLPDENKYSLNVNAVCRFAQYTLCIYLNKQFNQYFIHPFDLFLSKSKCVISLFYPIANKFPEVLQICVWIIELTVIHPLRVHSKSYSWINSPFIGLWRESASRELFKDLIPVFKLFYNYSVMRCVIICDCSSRVRWTQGHGKATVCQSHEFYHHYFNLYSTSVPSEIPIMTHSQTAVVIKLDIIIFY